MEPSRTGGPRTRRRSAVETRFRGARRPCMLARPMRAAASSGLLCLAILAGSPAASAQGISARFGNMVATYREDFSPRIEIEDRVGVVDRVLFEARAEGAENWHQAEARPTGRGSWWQGTFTSTSVWGARGEPRFLQVRAKILGRRGGVLLAPGMIEPLRVEVLTKPEVEARERVLRSYAEGGEEDLFTLTGYVGTEGRAGSGARARLVIGAGGSLSELLELAFYVSVGPAFERPSVVTGGGPLVLGFEAALRVFTRSPARNDLTLFVEPLGQVDLRLPGVDPGAGLRGGLSYQLGGSLAVELSAGGAVVFFRAIEPNDPGVEVGFTGGLRLVLRFGGPRPPKEST